MAVTTTTFCPSSSLSATLTGMARWGVRSSSRATTTPFSVTTTRLTPLPPDATAARVRVGWLTCCWSFGEEIETSRGPLPGTAGAGSGGVAGGRAAGPAGRAGTAAGGGVAGTAAAGGGAAAATVGGGSRLMTSKLSASMDADWILMIRRTSGAYHAVTCHDCAPGTCSGLRNASPESRFAV